MLGEELLSNLRVQLVSVVDAHVLALVQPFFQFANSHSQFEDHGCPVRLRPYLIEN